MSMRVGKIVTYLRPEDAHALIEFLDQLRDVMIQTYGNDIRGMLQEAIPPPKLWVGEDNDEAF